MIGCFGYDHPQWVPEPYPEELPASWRFCYYSNEIRSVVLPASALAGLDDHLVQTWSEDSDEAFRFVLELTPRLLDLEPQAGAKALLEKLSPLKDKLAAALVPGAVAADWAAEVQEALGTQIDLCTSEMNTSGRAWYPQIEPDPERCDGTLLALVEEATPKQLRAIIERLQQQNAGCGLFFLKPETAWQQVQSAQQLVDMMGVSRA